VLAASLSAFDPEPTFTEQLVAVHVPLVPFHGPDRCDTLRCVVLILEGICETPGVPRIAHGAAAWPVAAPVRPMAA
jgi:hypothetical protein